MKYQVAFLVIVLILVNVNSQAQDTIAICTNNFVISQGGTTYIEINATSQHTTIENSLLCLEPEATRPACTAENQGCLEYYTGGTSGPELQICTTRPDPDVDNTFDNGTYQWQSLTPEIELNNDYYVLGTDEDTINSGAPVVLDDTSFVASKYAVKIVDTATTDAEATVDFPVVVIGIDGNPIVAYREYTGAGTAASPTIYNIKMLFCKDPYCRDPTATTVTLNNPENAHIGGYLSMIIDTTGVPILATRVYVSSGVGQLAFIRCSDRFCSSNTYILPLATTAAGGDYGDYSAITIGGNGFPFIAFQANIQGGFYALQCTDLDCSTTAAAQHYPGTTNLVALTVEISPQTQYPVITVIIGSSTTSTTTAYFCSNMACTTAPAVVVSGSGTNPAEHYTTLDTSIADNGDLVIYACRSATASYCAIYYCSAIGGATPFCFIGVHGSASNSITAVYGVAMTVDGKGYPAQTAIATTAGGTSLYFSLCSDPYPCLGFVILGVTLDTVAEPTTGVETRQISMATGVYGYPVVAYATSVNMGAQKQIRMIALHNRFATPYFKR